MGVFNAHTPAIENAAVDLEKDGQGHTFSRSKYQKRVVGVKLKIFELSHVQIGHTVWAVGPLKKSMYLQFQC
jgi:hypothetical protein